MLHKVRAIVLKTTLYGESSVVAQVFTDKFGIQSYLINGVKKPKAKIPMNILQPLHLLDMVVYQKPNAQLQRVAEARAAVVFKSIPYKVIKNAMIQFVNEVLYKSIRQQNADENLFDFIYNAVAWFDETERTSVNFHLAFLLKLSRFLGFAPAAKLRADQRFFDLQEGSFTSIRPIHPHFISEGNADSFVQLFFSPFEKLDEIKIENTTRRFLLDKLLVYYALHTASFGQIKSHQVLEAVLS